MKLSRVYFSHQFTHLSDQPTDVTVPATFTAALTIAAPERTPTSSDSPVLSRAQPQVVIQDLIYFPQNMSMLIVGIRSFFEQRHSWCWEIDPKWIFKFKTFRISCKCSFLTLFGCANKLLYLAAGQDFRGSCAGWTSGCKEGEEVDSQDSPYVTSQCILFRIYLLPHCQVIGTVLSQILFARVSLFHVSFSVKWFLYICFFVHFISVPF